jgi:hypothetical protein
MIDMLKRHEIQVLRRAKHTFAEVAELAGVSQSSVQCVAAEPAVTTLDPEGERARRGVGRPAKVEAFRDLLAGELARQPDVLAVELPRRAALRVHFFASRLKYSRRARVSLVDNEQVEALVRTLVDHFAAFGGVPLQDRD